MSRIALPNLRIGGLRQFSFGDVIYDRANLYPNLDLDFATNKNLTDNKSGKTSIVSFSRSAASSPGTYVGADGLIHEAAVNFVLYSEQFNNAYWVKSGTTVEANQVAAPDGKQTADRLTPTATNAIHSLQTPSPYPASGNFSSYSVYVKADGYTKIALRESKSYGSYVSFDLSAGSVLDAAAVSSGKIEGYGIENVGSGWYRIYANFGDIPLHRWGLFALPESYTSGQPASSWLANGTDGYLIWGAQLEETDPALMGPSAYIKTTSQALCAPRFDHEPTSGNITTNLMLYSEMLDNTSVWTRLSSPTVTANNDTAPDGTETADDITDPSTNYSGIQQAFTGISGVQYATSLYLKKISVAPTSYPAIQLARGDGTLTTILINLQTGAINTLLGGSRVAPDSYSAVSDGDYWRITSVTTSAGSSMSYTLYPAFSLNGTSATATATGTVTAWGGQIEAASSAGTYVRTLGETRSISDATAESLGLLVEEQRVNYAAYSEDPSSWTFKSNVATTANAIEGPLENSGGWKLETTNTAVNMYVNKPSPAGTILTCWTVVKKGSGATEANEFRVRDDTAGLDILKFEINWDTNAITYILGSSGVSVEDVGNGWVKVVATVSWTSGNQVRYNIGFSASTVGVGEYFYFSHAQIEIGAFPTSYIPTTTSAQTRYADVAAIQDEDFSVTNLLSYSESFDAEWSTGGINTPVTANSIASPDGQTTADLVIESTFTGTHVIYQAFTSAAQEYSYSVYAKAKERTWIKLAFSTGAGGGAFFDLQNGVVGTVDSGYSATIEDAGDSWYRCKITATGTVAVYYPAVYIASNSSTISYAGDGTSGLYLWGAQLTATSYPVDYVSTRNLLTDSQDFERSSWTKYGIGGGVAPAIVSDSKYAPDGTDTGTEITFSAPSSGDQSFLTHSFRAISGGTYAGSFYVKGEGANIGKTILFRHAATSGYQTVTLTANWQRITRQETWGGATGTRTFAIGLRPGINGTLPDTVTAILWGAQIEPESTATEYYRTYDVVGKNYNWFEPTEGTVFVEAEPSPQGYGGQLWFNRDTTSNRGWSIVNGSTPTQQEIFFRGDDNSLKSFSLGSVTPGTFNKIVSAIDADDVLGVLNGGTVQSSALTVYYEFNQLRIGHQFTAGNNKTLNGHIKRIIYFPRRTKDSNLVLMTE